MAYLEERMSSGCRAVEAEQVGIFWADTQGISALGEVAWGELYDCLPLEDSGALFIESLLVSVFMPIDFQCWPYNRNLAREDMFSKNRGEAEEKKEGVDEVIPSKVKVVADPYRKNVCIY